MKLLVEHIEENKNIQAIYESVNVAGKKKDVLKIKGIFMSAEEKNRNGRVYPYSVLEKAVQTYQQDIQEGCAWGALDHPEHIHNNLADACHLITKLKMVGNDVYGEAIVMTDTEKGKIVENALSIGGKVGVSSRGVGEIEQRESANYVCEGFKIIAVDVVGKPSAHRAYVQRVNESVENDFVFQNGILVENKKETPVPVLTESDWESFLLKLNKGYIQ